MIEAMLVIQIAFFIFTSAYSFARPASFGAMLGLRLDGAAGVNEIRAQYGGFFLAVATAQTAALTGMISYQSALLLAIVVFGGLIFGRIVALIINRSMAGYSSSIRGLYLIDTVGFVSSTIALQTLS